MTIPVIAPYRMPTRPELPPSRATWRPEPRRAALLIHDMQQYFIDSFPAGERPVTDLVENTKRIRRVALAHDVPVLYTAQPGAMTDQQRGLLLDIWGPGMDGDPGSRQIIDELAPGPDQLVLTKWRYSAFVRSELEQVLRRQARDQLIICGVYAHVGCLMTAVDAFSRDIEPFLVADAVADFSRAHHQLALDYAAARCAVLLDSDQLLGLLSGSPGRSQSGSQ